MRQISIVCFSCLIVGLASAVSWDQSQPPDPSLWPYGDTNEVSEIPTPATYPGACYVYRPSAVEANGKVYVVGGRSTSPPSGYVAAHSHLSIFDPFVANPSNRWQTATWDGTGPCGINMGAGTRRPIKGNGVSPAGVALGVFDVDFDGTDELFLFCGENHPGNVVMMYDPDTDSWTNRTGTSGIVDIASCAGGQVGGKYYLHGAPNSIFVYDFQGDYWETHAIANFPKKTTQGGSASDDSKIYMPWGAYDDLSRTSSNSFGLAMYIYDPATPSNVFAGAAPPFGCNQAAVVAYRDRVYLFGGRIAGGADSSTNLIQVYFVASNSWYISKDTMPLNINAPAVWFANRRVFIANGYLFNNAPLPNQLSNVFWSCDIRQLDPPFPTALDVFPGVVDLGMAGSTGRFYVGDTGGIGLDYTNIWSVPWLTVLPAAGSTVGLAYRTNTFVVNRSLIAAPVTGVIQVIAAGSTSTVTVMAEPPTAKPVVTPPVLQTLQQISGLQFTLHNTGVLPFHFTNSASAGWITDITPTTGVLAPTGGSVTVTFNVGSVSPVPATGAVVVAGNAPTLQCQVIVNADTFYVAPTGSDSNNGFTPATAWRSLTHAFANVPNGAPTRPVVLHVAAGLYTNDCSLPGTNVWTLQLNNRSNLRVLGAGPEQSIIAPGDKVWPLVRGESDRVPSLCPLELRKPKNVEFAGFTILATNPPAEVLTNVWDSFCTIVGIDHADGLYLHHLYLNGSYTGPVYNADLDATDPNWGNWIYYAMSYRGMTGPRGLRLEHLLVRGGMRAFAHNNYGYTDDPANTSVVRITHCTFVEQANPGGGAYGVTIHNPGDHYAPGYIVSSSILGDIPVSTLPDSTEAYGLTCDVDGTGGGDLQMLAISNQVWSIGVPPPGDTWWNDFVIWDDGMGNDLNFTNEPPQFLSTPLPYSTDIATPYGDRDVGWHVIPEPTTLLMLAGVMLCRRGARTRS